MKKKLYAQDADLGNMLKQHQSIIKNANAENAGLNIIKNLLGGLGENDKILCL